MFFALKGDNFNGNTFAFEALKKGAQFVVIDEEKYDFLIDLKRKSPSFDLYLLEYEMNRILSEKLIELRNIHPSTDTNTIDNQDYENLNDSLAGILTPKQTSVQGQ